MTEPVQHFNIVMTLVRQGDKLHLQRRTGKKQSGAIGKIGTFGGEIENGETELAAAQRELAEESSVAVQQDQFLYLGELNVQSEKYGKPATVHAAVYEIDVAEDIAVEAREGELVTLSVKELRDTDKAQLSPALRELVTMIKER